MANLSGAAAEEMEVNSQIPIGEKRDISGGDGGVLKEIIKNGSGGETPENGDKVTVHYTGTLESDGSKFDSSVDRAEPFTFSLGGQVIKGWNIGVATMKKGEIAKFYIRSDYGYGDSGSPPKIPGGATLVFEIELLDWNSVKDIAGDGGIIKNITEEGSGWATPKAEDEALVTIAAKVSGNDAPFYQSPEGGDIFTVEDGFFCPAIKAAVKTMKRGEKVKMIVQPEYGFKEQGNAASEIEMTLVGFNKVENVTPDGGVVKKCLEETEDWQRPNAGATVTVSYIARTADGTVFDERSETDPLVFVTEEEQAPCEGFELAVMQMKKGEHAVITIKPEYAFGEQGCTGSKAAVRNTTVSYDVKLVDIVKAKESWDMDVDEKLEAARLAKDKGNGLFKAGNIAKALKVWQRAQQYIEYDDTFDGEKKPLSRALKQSLQLNVAAAYLKVKNPVEARKAAAKVLENDSVNMKALYRRAQSYIDTADWVEAAQDIKKGLQLEPNNVDFKLLGRKLKAAEAAASKSEAKLWANSFAKMAKKSASQQQNEEEKTEAAEAAES